METANVTSSGTQNSYAGFGRRFLAYWVDFIILFPVELVVQQMMGVNPFAIFQAQSLEQLQQIRQSSAGGLPTVVSLALALAFFLIMWVNFDGATPGKKLMAIKIVKADGSKVSYPVAFIRYIGYLLSAFVFMLGYLWIIWDKKKQGWHDKIAGTVVVKTSEQPKTFLAVILAMVAIIGMTCYMGAAMFQEFGLSYQEVVTKNIGRRTAQSLKQNKDNMSTEAKIHYDKSQQLFTQMRAVQTNPEAIKPIADQTIKEAKLAVDIEPNNPFLWSNLGDAYGWPNTVGTAEDSLNAYKKAEELDPNNVVYINFVGDQLMRMGRYEEAVLQFQKTLRLTDTSGFAHLSVGKAYKGLKMYDEARTHFNKAIEVFQAENDKGQYDAEILDAQKELRSLPR